MRTVMTTCIFPADYPMEDAVKRLASIGYDGIDIYTGACTNRQHPLMAAGWKDYAARLRDAAAQHGAACTHSHLPGEVDMSHELLGDMLRGLAAAGVNCSVAHPVWQRNGAVITEEDEFFSINVPLYKSLLRYAEEYGIVLLCENLCWGPSMSPAVMSKLVEEMNSPYFGWCFDTGHANIFGIDATQLQGLRAPYSLHVQDNHGGKPGDKERRHASMYTDEHLMPFDGTIDWALFSKTLPTLGYTGDFVLEATHQPGEAPDEEKDAVLKELLQRAARIRAMIPR